MDTTTAGEKKKIGFKTASAIVVANMIGTGVFTSVGFQLISLHNTWTILLLWLCGGVLALCGAFAYAELGTHFKESGGDYIYLSRIFHPVAGYLSAWAGLTIGFSAPIALAAMAFTKFLAPFGLHDNVWFAIGLIILVALMHSLTLRHSSRFHNSSTVIKVLFIVVLIVLGLLLPVMEHSMVLDNSWQREIRTPGFAVSMVYVSFAYTGWNAAAYVADEIRSPSKNIPKALIGSTVFVGVIYIVFQFVLLRNATLSQLRGKEEVTYIAFTNILGQGGGRWVSAFIAVQLVATISSYLWVGPRVTRAMALEFTLWRVLSRTNSHGIPVAAIWAHVFISILLTLTGSFEKVMLYSGFVLQLMASLTVASSLFLRSRTQKAFRSPLRPVLQVLFLIFNAAVLVFTLIDRPMESLAGLGILSIGLLIYFFDRPSVTAARKDISL